MNKRLTDKEIISLCHDVQIGTGGMDYADALTKIAEELTLRGEQETPQEAWIPCAQKMPPTGLFCWVVWNGYVQRVAYKRVGRGFACVDGYAWECCMEVGEDKMKDGDVSHWMPLPKPPTKPVAPPLPYQEENK